MQQFKIGDSVTPLTGPFKGVYGVIIFFDDKENRILVRINGTQQLYFKEAELTLWENKA